MKAIKVTFPTFWRIEREVSAIGMRTIRSYFDASYQGFQHSEQDDMYVVLDELTGDNRSSYVVWHHDEFFSNYILMTDNHEDWSNYPYNWFEVRPILRKDRSDRGYS